MVDSVDTLVVGAGQAGIAASAHLTRHGIPHLVLEKDRIAESWRTRRWDSLVANGPAWHDCFPGMQFPRSGPEAFPPKEEVAEALTGFAEAHQAPIRTGVAVNSVTRAKGRSGFVVDTSDGPIEAQNVIAATGAFHHPVFPKIIPDTANVTQIHSASYRNPDQLSEGAVLVLGAGSSGGQIADELQRAGRKVYLCVGPHDRPPRAYRGRDYCWWLGVLGLWDVAAKAPGTEHVTISVSGARGGETVDFRKLAHGGMTLLGRASGYKDGKVLVDGDLVENIAAGDANYFDMLKQADAYIDRFGLDLPEEPEAHVLVDDPECLTHPLCELDLAAANVTNVIWATGYTQDFSWIDLPNACDANGAPYHQRGASPEPGLYFLGLPWQSRRGSTFIWGVWHDASHVADQIEIQRSYREYHPESA
ncbi:NAD(P)/FAD-dependent oxidoreductase [Shimia thalassica]|uniref:flavin-containing monooxygenase n=1 Tax=Shimia thalassica TaxID=1715693 RepID=UPI0027339A8A|nr:NAD(P)/FAD-dependent oxidoreductase [Shimia thalassica]MDP2494209.1 NAD(P)/FAD-dependent oxidoreductase [Shimia thalassica]